MLIDSSKTFGNPTGHAVAFYKSPMANVYEYDPAEDGPEVETVVSIRINHPFYKPGLEFELYAQRFVHPDLETLREQVRALHADDVPVATEYLRRLNATRTPAPEEVNYGRCVR